LTVISWVVWLAKAKLKKPMMQVGGAKICFAVCRQTGGETGHEAEGFAPACVGIGVLRGWTTSRQRLS